jgi:phosphate acetyltransferase
MARTLLVLPTAGSVGLARICLGLVRALDRRGVNVGFVKPVAQLRPDGGPDRSAALVAAMSALRPPDPLSTAQLEEQLGAGGLDVALEKIIAAWHPVDHRSDVVVVEGLSPRPNKLYVSTLNQALARALDADVVLVSSWPEADAGSREDGADLPAHLRPDRTAGTAGTVERLAETLAVTAGGYWSGEQERVVGCVVNGVPASDPRAATQLGEALAERGLRLIAGVLHRPELTWLRMRDLIRELDARVFNEGDLSRRIEDVACSPKPSRVACACLRTAGSSWSPETVTT